MNESFTHIDIGNIVTWCGLLFVAGMAWASQKASSAASMARAKENGVKIDRLANTVEGINKDGSTGARHLFDLIHASVSAQETRIVILESSARDTVEIKTEVRWMRKLMEKRWGLGGDPENGGK